MHAVVVVGFNYDTDHWFINDPSETEGEELDMRTFSEAWSYSYQLTATITQKASQFLRDLVIAD